MLASGSLSVPALGWRWIISALGWGSGWLSEQHLALLGPNKKRSSRNVITAGASSRPIPSLPCERTSGSVLNSRSVPNTRPAPIEPDTSHAHEASECHSTATITALEYLSGIVPSRRDLIAGVAGSVSLTAGCLSNEATLARCASRGEGGDSQHLREIAPITGDEQVSLGILVSEQAVTEETYHTVEIRDSDDHLIASIPLLDDRDMSRLEPDDHSVFGSDSGELYAVPMGPPPIHGEYSVSLVNPDGDPLTTASIRFNCYAEDGKLP